MRSVCLAAIAAFTALIPSSAFGQLSITNYQFVSEQRVTRTQSDVTYSADLDAMFRRQAYFVDRILKGANPGDLAVEQPRDFEFVINLKAAQDLGLTVPPTLLLQATDVVR